MQPIKALRIARGGSSVNNFLPYSLRGLETNNNSNCEKGRGEGDELQSITVEETAAKRDDKRPGPNEYEALPLSCV